jgi:heat shock protein HslJ
MLRLFLSLPILLAACLKDETVSGYVDQTAVFHLVEFDAIPYQGAATISFPETGQVRGQGPCNTYAAQQSAPYPWFSIGPLRATRRACDDLVQETRFFRALESMTVIEVSGTVVILRNDAGRKMVFQSDAP